MFYVVRRVQAVTLVLWSAIAATAAPDVKLAAIFADHMVLQRDCSVPVWGTAEPDTSITVFFAGQEKTAQADQEGNWRLRLDPMPAERKSRVLEVLAGSARDAALSVRDVLVGDVWLCSGQSNMAMGVNRCKNAEQEIAAADFPMIRHNKGAWVVCSPETVAGFSGTAYFFGRHLYRHLQVPIGLVNRSVGGTPIEFWTPAQDLLELPYAKGLYERYNTPEMQQAYAAAQPLRAEYRKQVKAWRAERKAGNTSAKPPKPPRVGNLTRTEELEMGIYRAGGPGCLYRRHIEPLEGVAIRGIIWYQGERNTKTGLGAFMYRKLLPLMIHSWRKNWNRDDLPFLYVQLPNYRSKTWPVMRESMLKTLAVPHTGMAVVIDAGETTNIHPGDKQTVGERLGLAARHVAYGEDLVYSGPLFGRMTVEGSQAVLIFRHTGTGLVAAGDGPLRGFRVAGKDRKWHPAEAAIRDDTVVVASDKVASPVAVRYAWDADPACTLYNREGLPASPFRTDTWED